MNKQHALIITAIEAPAITTPGRAQRTIFYRTLAKPVLVTYKRAKRTTH